MLPLRRVFGYSPSIHTHTHTPPPPTGRFGHITFDSERVPKPILCHFRRENNGLQCVANEGELRKSDADREEQQQRVETRHRRPRPEVQTRHKRVRDLLREKIRLLADVLPQDLLRTTAKPTQRRDKDNHSLPRTHLGDFLPLQLPAACESFVQAPEENRHLPGLNQAASAEKLSGSATARLAALLLPRPHARSCASLDAADPRRGV